MLRLSRLACGKPTITVGLRSLDASRVDLVPRLEQRQLKLADPQHNPGSEQRSAGSAWRAAGAPKDCILYQPRREAAGQSSPRSNPLTIEPSMESPARCSFLIFFALIKATEARSPGITLPLVGCAALERTRQDSNLQGMTDVISDHVTGTFLCPQAMMALRGGRRRLRLGSNLEELARRNRMYASAPMSMAQTGPATSGSAPRRRGAFSSRAAMSCRLESRSGLSRGFETMPPRTFARAVVQASSIGAPEDRMVESATRKSMILQKYLRQDHLSHPTSERRIHPQRLVRHGTEEA